jgi:hypothetical protein
VEVPLCAECGKRIEVNWVRSRVANGDVYRHVECQRQWVARQERKKK